MLELRVKNKQKKIEEKNVHKLLMNINRVENKTIEKDN